jgi:glycosyltransferase 2 family protein
MLKAVKLLLLVSGVAVAGWLVWQHGADIRTSLAQVGLWGVLLYLVVSFAAYALDALGWRAVFAAEQPGIGFGRVFSIRMAGEAVNKVTPLASLGGEPLKAFLLARSGGTVGDAAASVAVSKNVMTLAQVAFIFCGIAIAAPAMPEHRTVLLGFGVFPTLVLSAITVTAILDHRLRRGRTGDRAKPSRVVELWGQFADYFYAHPREVALSFLWFFLGWAAGALELLVAAQILGFNLSVKDALVMESLLCSVNMATFFIPANAGSQEGGYAFLGPLLGLSAAHGITMAILRRCRDVMWVGYGLLYLSVTEGRILFKPGLEAAEPVV